MTDTAGQSYRLSRCTAYRGLFGWAETFWAQLLIPGVKTFRLQSVPLVEIQLYMQWLILIT